MYENVLGVSRICPICGRSFIISDPDTYAYTANKKYFCSWGCLRKHRRNQSAKRVMPDEYRDDYFTVTEASKILGVKYDSLKRTVLKGRIPAVLIPWEGRTRYLIRKEDVYDRQR